MNKDDGAGTPAILLPVSEVPKVRPFVTEFSLRHYIYNSKPLVDFKGRIVKEGNGLSPAIIRLGRRVLIDLEKFDEWVLSHRDGEKANV